MTKTRRQAWSSERGTAILETAMTLPLLLLVSVGIFEFGRAYQVWQVLTNAAREGARVAVLPNPVAGAPEARVRQYLTNGQLPNPGSANVAVTAATVSIGGGATATASVVTVTYPFSFIVLQPVARLLVNGSTLGSAVTLTASSEMRNEAQ
jgi:Flp pilus assembly protein TadG